MILSVVKIKKLKNMKKLSFSLDDLYIFYYVVHLNGFTAAANQMGMPKSKISRRITVLEESVGQRLLQRNPRSISLTHAGENLFKQATEIVQRALDGEESLRSLASEPAGSLKISLPEEISRELMTKQIIRFVKMYPKISININISNRLVEFISDGFDIAIRGGVVSIDKNSTLICTKLFTANWVMVSSPMYLQAHGTPKEIFDLENMNYLAYSQEAKHMPSNRFFHENGETYTLKSSKNFISNNHIVLKSAVLAGLGIACLPKYAIINELSDGSLVSILPGWKTTSGELYAVFPSKDGMATATRLFLDFLKKEVAAYLQVIDESGRCIGCTEAVKAQGCCFKSYGPIM